MTELTMESANKLHNQMRQQIPFFEGIADNCATVLNRIKELPETDATVALKCVSETLLMLCYINLDLMAAYRQYLSTDTSTHYENRQSITKINIVISESYKRIYGFGEKIKESFWIAKIKKAVDFLGQCDDEYQQIEEELKLLKSNNVVNREMRDLAVHYDSDPMKVYIMLSALSAEEVASRCTVYMQVLEKVTAFVNKLLDLLVKMLM
jgi:hypothetical protein